mmetsp:Transcript_31822/g.95697  ORF Transcript_31822/g.95697 Transcript_31822/m.95697 type:complete len:261 (+) Transcript_31822:207-989(+)
MLTLLDISVGVVKRSWVGGQSQFKLRWESEKAGSHIARRCAESEGASGWDGRFSWIPNADLVAGGVLRQSPASTWPRPGRSKQSSRRSWRRRRKPSESRSGERLVAVVRTESQHHPVRQTQPWVPNLSRYRRRHCPRHLSLTQVGQRPRQWPARQSTLLLFLSARHRGRICHGQARSLGAPPLQRIRVAGSVAAAGLVAKSKLDQTSKTAGREARRLRAESGARLLRRLPSRQGPVPQPKATAQRVLSKPPSHRCGKRLA